MASGHAGHGHAGLPDHADTPAHPGMPDHPSMPMNGDVCGYCTLMCHNPVLASVLAFIVLPLPRVPYSTAHGRVDTPVATLLERRSRGPPVA